MTTIKFFYNGLKVNGSRKLQKAHYSLIKTWENEAAGRTIKDQIVIYAREYEGFSDEVRELFTVENDTDSQTDYFEKDRIRVFPSHPLFSAVLEGFEKQENRKIAKWTKAGRTSQAADLKEKIEYARNLLLNEELSEEAAETVEEPEEGRCDCAASNLDRHCTFTAKTKIDGRFVCGRHLNVLRKGGEIFEVGTYDRIDLVEERPETVEKRVSSSDEPEAAAEENADERADDGLDEAIDDEFRKEELENLRELVSDLRIELLKSEDEKKILREEIEGLRRDRNDRVNKVRDLRGQLENERRDGLDAALRRIIREELEIEVSEETETSGESTYQSIKVALRIKGDEEAFDEDGALLSIS